MNAEATTMTTFAALLTGLATSIHCVGMCGPIACGLGSMAKSETSRMIGATLYHGCRLTSYTLIGAVCGAIGSQPLKWFFDSPAVILPWVLVAVLLLVATGLDQKIPRPKVLNRFTTRTRLQLGKRPAIAAAGIMGLLTPLLPCGPLYAVFAMSLASGSAAKGAEFMLAFGIGTVPLLWLAQQQFQRIRSLLGPKGMVRLRRGLALATALMMAWRLHDTLPFNQPAAAQPKATAPAPATQELPSCCH